MAGRREQTAGDGAGRRSGSDRLPRAAAGRRERREQLGTGPTMARTTVHLSPPSGRGRPGRHDDSARSGPGRDAPGSPQLVRALALHGVIPPSGREATWPHPLSRGEVSCTWASLDVVGSVACVREDASPNEVPFQASKSVAPRRRTHTRGDQVLTRSRKGTRADGRRPVLGGRVATPRRRDAIQPGGRHGEPGGQGRRGKTGHGNRHSLRASTKMRPSSAQPVPSGILEPGEEPALGIVRKGREETGVRVQPEAITSVTVSPPVTHGNGDRAQYLEVCFRCRPVSGTAHVNDDESLEVDWFSTDALPPLVIVVACVSNTRWSAARHGSRVGPDGRTGGS